MGDYSGAGGGITPPAGDIGGTTADPTVVSTHLTAALPIAQGGTGSATKNFVDLTTAQTVAGIKTLTDVPGLLGANLASGQGSFVITVTDNYNGLKVTGGSYPTFNLENSGGSGASISVNAYGLIIEPNGDINSFIAVQNNVTTFNQDSAKPIQFNSPAAAVVSQWVDGTLTCSGYGSAIKTVTTTYTITNQDSTILAGGTTAYTVTLPTAVGIKGRQYTIKNTTTTLSTITVASAGGTIDTAASVALSSANEAITVQSDGTNWWVIGQVATTIL